MDIQSIIFSVAGFLIVTLLSACVFFLKRQFSKNDKMGDDISQIKLTIQAYTDRFDLIKSDCTHKHDAISKEFAAHDKRISDVEYDIKHLKK